MRNAPDPTLYPEIQTSDTIWKARFALAARSLKQNWSLFLSARIGVIGLSVIMFYALLAISHPILMNFVWEERVYDPVIGYSFDETRQPAPPSLSHPLGTDPLGRDILSQLMYSARSEFLLGLLAAIVTVTIGNHGRRGRSLLRRRCGYAADEARGHYDNDAGN